MKKTILIFAILAIPMMGFTQQAQQPKQPEQKILRLEGDINSFQVLLSCIENSSAPHNQVVALNKWIVDQLQPQVAQQIPAKTDSTPVNPKKKK